MITKENLEKLWSETSHSNLGEFEYKLLSIESFPQLNIGYNNVGERCLLLELPNSLRKEFKQEEKENLSLRYFAKEHCLCIILNDDFFSDLFDDLILSIYSKTYEIVVAKEYAELFVMHFFKWSAFFELKSQRGLSSAQIKGLFGELVFLREQIAKSEFTIDQVLNSWRGPYDVGHDFVNEYIDFEIKTIEVGRNCVNISSEYQLEHDSGKELELVLVVVDTDIISGLSIADIAHEIKKMVFQRLGDQSIFLAALSQKGLDIKSLSLYDSFKFITRYLTYYRASDEEFPKLLRSTLPDEVFETLYSIRLNLIDKFISKKIVI